MRLLVVWGLGERFSSPSGSGRSPAAKRYLVNFRLKISPLVATIFRSFSGNKTSNSSNWGDWVAECNIFDFHAGLPEVWGSNPGREKKIFVCIYLPSLSYKCYVAVYWVSMCIVDYDFPVFAFKVMHRVILLTRFYHRLRGSGSIMHCCNDDQQSQWEDGNFDPL